MQARAIAAVRRRHKAAGESLDPLSDEQVWAFIRGAVKTDIGWAMMGSAFHVTGMRDFAKELFGIEIPARMERWPSGSTP
jgi:hypothetical protein